MLLGEDYRQGIEAAIAQEKAGLVPQRGRLHGERIQTWVEVGLLVLFGVGLLVGIPDGIRSIGQKDRSGRFGP